MVFSISIERALLESDLRCLFTKDSKFPKLITYCNLFRNSSGTVRYVLMFLFDWIMA